MFVTIQIGMRMNVDMAVVLSKQIKDNVNIIWIDANYLLLDSYFIFLRITDAPFTSTPPC